MADAMDFETLRAALADLQCEAPPPGFFTTAQVCEAMALKGGRARELLSQWRRTGKLPSTLLGAKGGYIYKGSEVLAARKAFMAAKTKEAGPCRKLR